MISGIFAPKRLILCINGMICIGRSSCSKLAFPLQGNGQLSFAKCTFPKVVLNPTILPFGQICTHPLKLICAAKYVVHACLVNINAMILALPAV